MYEYLGVGSGFFRFEPMMNMLWSFVRSITWNFNGGSIYVFMRSIMTKMTNMSIETVFSVFDSSTAIFKLTSWVTLLGILFILVRVGFVFFQSSAVNIENQTSAPNDLYLRRIVFGLITLSLAPAVIINGFIIATVIPTALIRINPSTEVGKEPKKALVDILASKEESKYINYQTFCLRGQEEGGASEKALAAASIGAHNKKSNKFQILARVDQMGGMESLPGNATRNGLSESDVNKLYNAFCLGYPVTQGDDPGSKFPSWKTTTPAEGKDGFRFDSSTTGMYPHNLMESISYDTESVKQSNLIFGNASSIKEISALQGDESEIVNLVLSITFMIMQLALAFQFIKDMFERIVGIFGAVFSVWLYAPSYVSTQRNNMIGELVKRVASIYLTQMYSIILLELWSITVLTDTVGISSTMTDGSTFFIQIFLKIGLTYGFYTAMKNGNSSMQQFFDKTSSGDALQGLSKVSADVFSGIGKG